MSDASSTSLVDAATSSVAARSDVFEAMSPDEAGTGVDLARSRRIAYFMLFRLAILAAFTVLAGLATYASGREPGALFTGFVWGSLAVGYLATIVFARWLRRARALDRLAWAQTSFDILAAAVVVQMTGGVDSGFAFMWLMAVLGAAIMGGPRLTWAAAASCSAIWIVTSTLQFLGWVEPIVLGEVPAPMPPLQHWLTVGRTVAAIAGVTVLSSYLNAQIASSASQVVDLRALNEHIVRSLGSGLISCGPDGRVLYFNPAAREILHLTDDDLGLAGEDLLPGLAALPSPDAEPASPRSELEVTTRTGQRLHVGLSRTPLLDGRGLPIGEIVIFQDLTRLHELTEKVRRNERLAALGGMAASVAHEIRNPLAAISGSAELLASLELGHEDQRLLSIIRRESSRLSDLVTDLLAFTRPREPQLSRVDLARVTRETCEAFAADPSNRSLKLEISADAEAWAEIDAVQLSQVLWNLLRNASEAMDGKGRIRVRVSRHPGHVRISVTDDGPGIPGTLRERIFDPFFTTKDDGTGFGLAIAHRVVEDNGGTLALDERLEHGTRFVVRFPEANAAPSATART